MTTAAAGTASAPPKTGASGRLAALRKRSPATASSARVENSDPVPVAMVAEYLLLEAAVIGGSLNYAALQAGCYYAQAYHLHDWAGRPLFEAPVTAGGHGPRIPALDRLYAAYGDDPIPPPDDPDLPFPFSHAMQPLDLSVACARVANHPHAVVPRPHGEEPWQRAYRTAGPGAIVDRTEMAEWAERDIKQWFDDVLNTTAEEWEARVRALDAGLPYIRD